MSGFTSPYEEDNPFADMHSSGAPVSPQLSQSPVSQDVAQGDENQASEPAEATVKKESVPDESQHTLPSTPPRESERRAPQKAGSARRPGGGRRPVRASAIVSSLEALDIGSGPLGPLGSADTEVSHSPQGPEPPIKDSAGTSTNSMPNPGTNRSDETPTSARSGTINETSRPPSVPLEQAANPQFSISVGDPTKIGDITSAHTVYKVTTKTTSQAFKAPECSVTRRFRDFLWLNDQLNRNCPGVIVPPTPEKQAVGRFSDNFIEARRYALERMLEKISKHPILRNDSDFKLFLESETFTADVKQKPIDQRSAHESNKGFLGLGSAFSMSGKFIEADEFFDQQKAAFDALDQQLKQLSKAVDVVIRQRRDLAQTTAEFGAALSALSTIELSRSLSDALGSLSDLQDKIRDLHERQAQQDLLTLGHTVEEYIRLISSVKAAFSARQKAWFAWQNADADSAKRRSTGDKIRRQARSQQDRLSMVDQEMTEAEKKSLQYRTEFENVSKLLKQEIHRFEADKVEDFKTSVEVFLESSVEAQKEIIEYWEFYTDLLAKELGDEESSNRPQEDSQAGSAAPASSALSIEDSAQSQEESNDDSAQERITPTPPTTADSTQSSGQGATSSRLPISPDEANPFARESI